MSDTEFEIREQPRLPVGRQLEICADGVRHRFVRSLLTMSVVTLAVAFLMNMLTESTVVRSCKAGVSKELRRQQRLADLLRVCRTPESTGALRRRLMEIYPESVAGRVLRGWAGLERGEHEALRLRCRHTAAALDWLANLKLAHRRMLFGDTATSDVLGTLAGAEAQERLRAKLLEAPSLSLPAHFAEAASGYKGLEAQLAAIRRRLGEGSAELNRGLGGRSLEAALASAAGAEERRRLRQRLASRGVKLSASELANLAEEARRRQHTERLLACLADPDLNEAWRKKYNEALLTEEAVDALAAGSSRGRWLGEQIGEPLAAGGVRPAELPSLARRYRGIRRAESIQSRLAAEYGSEEGIGANTLWLVAMAFLVCIVGITNAMLVSVLERFREIATMKCLGAMDGLIAVLFLLESAFLGLAGAAAGVVLGAAVGLGRMSAGLGSWVWVFFPWRGMLAMAGVSALAGLVLTTLSAVYPAYRAARMAPMEAMRVE